MLRVSEGGAPTLARGHRIGGKYVVERLLGRGGMGAVYLATHEALGSQVAVKVLSASSEVHSARFVREARILASLRSEHVAKVVDFGILDDVGVPYMVMEYLPGEDLSVRIEAAYAEMSTAEAVDCVLEACEALAEAHRIGIVHRDIKPSNLFLTVGVDGSPMTKVLDFGIAKINDNPEERSLTATDMVFGSPAYMSPEQVRSAKFVGPPTDVWSIALVLYELLAKHLPFSGDSAASFVVAIATDEPTPIAHPLWPTLSQALRKDPALRPTLLQFAAALGSYASERGRVALRRIERIHSASLPPPPQETVALANSTGRRASIRVDEAQPRDTTLGVNTTDRAKDNEEVAASARTTLGTVTKPASSLHKVALGVGGALVLALGVGVGMRATRDRAIADTTPPPPASSTLAAIEPAVEPTSLPLASAEPASEPPDAGATAEEPVASKSHKSSGKSPVPSAKSSTDKPAPAPSAKPPPSTPAVPRGDQFN